MTEASHQLLRRVFDAAQELPPPERAAFVARECGADEALRERIAQLLAAGEHTQFLSSPEQAHMAETAIAAGEGVGSTIGPYTLRRELGEGGFGMVFLAEQTQPVARQVALKVLKPGMDSRQIVARFEQERQALARMEHPHIARVIDAGTTAAGRPFFVMEFVDGLPLVDYCDRRQLSVRQRLELFVQVCDAVQHAHGRGLLHRDLKPSNVLVAEQDGKPFGKVIDFGIAKAIRERGAERTALTEAQQVLGTLLYMSPEQAEGAQDLDVRTDVFSLGAMLYELLAGTSPFDVATIQGAWQAELQRRIRETDPAPPSRRLTASGERLATLAQHRHTTVQRLPAQVRGELDWIVMKALEKERDRRYATAHAFAEDLRRHLAGEPVEAAPPSASYRVRKFVRNHRWQVAAAVALLLSLVGGASAFAWQAEVARRERDNADGARIAEAAQRQRADERAAAEHVAREQAEAMTRFVTEALESSDPYRGGKQGMLVREAMERAVGRLDAGTLQSQPRLEVPLRTRIAAILYHNQGAEAAVAVAKRAVALARQLGPEHEDQLVSALGVQAVAMAKLSSSTEALALLEESLALQQDLVTGDDAMTALLLVSLARMRMDLGDPRGAVEPADAALAMTRRLWQGDSHEIASALVLVANVAKQLGRMPASEQHAEQALAMHRRLFAEDHPDIAGALAALANAQLLQGKHADAIANYESLVAMQRRLFGADEHVAIAIHNLAVAHWTARHADLAEPLFVEALELHRKAFPADHRAIARNLKNLGDTWRILGKQVDAERVLQESVAMWQRLFPDGHPEYAESLDSLALLHRGLGRLDDALRELDASITMRRAMLGPDHPHLVLALSPLGEVHEQKNAPALAVPAFRETVAILKKMHGDDFPNAIAVQARLANALLNSGEPGEAAPLFQDAIERQTRRDAKVANLANWWTGLARARQESGDAVGARAAFDEAITRFAQLAPDGSAARARTLGRSGSARLAGGDAKAALVELEAALAMGTKVLPANHPQLAEYRAAVEACKTALAR